MPAEPLFFICGTPKDRVGFVYNTLDGGRLPEAIANEIDRLSQHQDMAFGPEMPVGICCRVKTGDADGLSAFYAEYQSIQPSDADHNRGAYIAVGYWTDAPINDLQAEAAFWRIKAIHSSLAAKRDGGHAFPPDFDLSHYALSASERSWGQSDELSQSLRNCGILSTDSERSQPGTDDLKPEESQKSGDSTGEKAPSPGTPQNSLPQKSYLSQIFQSLYQIFQKPRESLEMVIMAILSVLWGGLSIAFFLAVRALVG